MFERIKREDLQIYSLISEKDLNTIIDFINYRNDNNFIKIGEGGFGIVFAYKKYAIKIFKYKDYKEIRMLSKLQGISSYPILYAGCEYFMVTELIDGKVFFKCNETYYFSVNNDCISILFKDIQKTLKRKIRPYDVHRENIMIDKEGYIKIIDIGHFEEMSYNPVFLTPKKTVQKYIKKYCLEECLKTIEYIEDIVYNKFKKVV